MNTDWEKDKYKGDMPTAIQSFMDYMCERYKVPGAEVFMDLCAEMDRRKSVDMQKERCRKQVSSHLKGVLKEGYSYSSPIQDGECSASYQLRLMKEIKIFDQYIEAKAEILINIIWGETKEGEENAT